MQRILTFSLLKLINGFRLRTIFKNNIMLHVHRHPFDTKQSIRKRTDFRIKEKQQHKSHKLSRTQIKYFPLELKNKNKRLKNDEKKMKFRVTTANRLTQINDKYERKTQE